MANFEPNTERGNRDDNRHELERLIARYADEFRAGKSPRIEDYIRRYPQYAVELGDFFVYFHSVGMEAPEPDPVPAPQLSPVAQKALARIHQQYAEEYALDGLVKQGKRVNLTLRQIAQQVTLTTDVLLKLEARVIDVSSIPRTLIRRLAEALQVAPEAVALYLGGPASASVQPGFYYADQAPTQKQESFLDAIQESAQLSAESKAEWAHIVHDEFA